MLIKKPSEIKSSEITDEKTYHHRRRFILAASAASIGLMSAACRSSRSSSHGPVLAKLEGLSKSQLSTTESPNSFKDITTYNNFYEFGTDKSDPAEYAGRLKPRPWTVAIEGEINKPKVFDIDQLLKIAPLEERIYRHRCVEAWSMVIPWVGFPLHALINLAEPTSKAKYIQFVTLKDPDQMPGQRSGVLGWPYVEGLRMDEARHPLAILAVGLDGQVLPNQNGAPIRLVLPWKYGFKSIKSIVKLRFVESEPATSWNLAAPNEYGFYSNVNPAVNHPRWSQATERRIGELSKRSTQIFNGYADQVAQLYSGLDLRKYF